MGKKIEREAERLEQETGIDFKKYRNPETVEKISDPGKNPVQYNFIYWSSYSFDYIFNF